MTVQVLEADGKPAFVILSYEEYAALIEKVEDLDDARALTQFVERVSDGSERTVPSSVLDRLLDGEPPIRVWRDHRGMTAAQLAARVGVTPAHISKLETRKGEPSLSLLRRLSSALDVETDLLLEAEGG